jgi:UDP-N-acetylglucosamine 2-epimerase
MLAQGDTTTFAGALAAFCERITVGHVAAGLQTGTGSLLGQGRSTGG